MPLTRRKPHHLSREISRRLQLNTSACPARPGPQNRRMSGQQNMPNINNSHTETRASHGVPSHRDISLDAKLPLSMRSSLTCRAPVPLHEVLTSPEREDQVTHHHPPTQSPGWR